MFKFLMAIMLMVSFTLSAAPTRTSPVTTMLSAQTATGVSEAFTPWGAKRTFYAKGTTTAGAGAATIVIEATNSSSTVNGNWVNLATISLTLGTTSVSDGFAADSAWRFVRARVTAISGTGASVNVYMATE